MKRGKNKLCKIKFQRFMIPSIDYKYCLREMKKNATKKREHRKIMLQNTFMTESDISLSFSHDGQLFNYPLEKDKTEDKHTQFVKQQALSSDGYDSDLLFSVFQEAIKQRLLNPTGSSDDQKIEVKQEAQEDMRFEQKRKRSTYDTIDKDLNSEESLDLSDEDLFTSKEEQDQYNAQHSLKGQKEQMLNEQNIRTKMKEIDFTIKRLHLERNRLKYFLRKDKEVNTSDGEQNLATKECPCCGKLISKLCFRCEHLYCKAENCPRKKKQVLNARMLEKMREKKGGEPTRKSKKNRLRLKGQLKEDIQQVPSSEQELSQNFDQENDESLTISYDKPVITTRSTRSKNSIKQKAIDEMELSRLLKISDSDISIRNSQLFLDSTSQ